MTYETATYPNTAAAPQRFAVRERATLPELWRKARAAFSGLLDYLPHREARAAQIAAGEEPAPVRLPREDRAGIRDWLSQIEQEARVHIVAQALIFLMMTPLGQAMLKAAPRFERHKPKPRRSTIIPHPGAHTIARHWQREPEPEPALQPRPASSANANPRRRKPVLSVFNEVMEEGEAAIRFSKRQDAAVQAQTAQREQKQSAKPSSSGPGQPRPGSTFEARTERRIEALQHTFENPESLILRTAHQIAKLAAERLGAIRQAAWRLPRRDPGNRDYADLCLRLSDALNTYIRHLEPG